MSIARPLLAVSLGDPHGIGPEVAWKAARDAGVSHAARVALVGPRDALVSAGARDLEEVPMVTAFENIDPGVSVTVVDPWSGRRPFDEHGSVSADAGRMSMESVELATRACLSGAADALVTAPISKEAIRLAGFPFPGHTEYLAALTQTESVVMMLATDRLDAPLRVALATIHIPVSQIVDELTTPGIKTTLVVLAEGLARRFGVESPEIAVLGLNPHAGEGGVIGREEIDVIAPAMDAARREGVRATGPHPADAFFGQGRWREVDAVLAMYHDQGLAPFKALAMGKGVNFTMGLPIVRASPDHGTAFDIAGRGVADPSSMIEAMQVAARAAVRHTG